MAATATIRRFTWADLPRFTPVFNAVKGVAGTEWERDEELVGQMLSHPSCRANENGFVAEAGDALVGFVLVAPELPIGRAVAVGGVLPSHRRMGIGGRLLWSAIEHSARIRAPALHVQLPEDGEGARHLMEREGFHQVRSYSELTWDGGAIPALKIPHNLSLRSFRPGEDETLLTRLQNAAFRDNWGFCPNSVEDIRARVRFKQFDPAGILLVMDGPYPAGYAWTSRAYRGERASGRIEMTGTHPRYRGVGIGRAVVSAAMAHLRSRGVNSIELEVDLENWAGVALFRSLGFRGIRKTLWLEKRLPAHR